MVEKVFECLARQCLYHVRCYRQHHVTVHILGPYRRRNLQVSQVASDALKYGRSATTLDGGIDV